MGDIERMENVISEHAVSIALMTKAVSSIENLLTQQTVSIREIEKAMKAQELIMEKLANLDTRMTDSVNRVHKRIDTQEADMLEVRKDIVAIKKEHKDSCDAVKPMAQKGADVHGLLVKGAIGLASAVAIALGTIVLWAVKQGALK